MSEPKITVHTVKALDTGIGRAAGYESDEAMVAAHEAERAMWSSKMREIAEKVDRDLTRAFLVGE